MRESPGLNETPQRKNEDGRQRESHAPVSKNPGKREQRQRECRTKIKSPELENLVSRSSHESGQNTGFVELAYFPSGVVVAHHRVMVLRHRPLREKQEVRNHGIGFAVDRIRHPKWIS